MKNLLIKKITNIDKVNIQFGLQTEKGTNQELWFSSNELSCYANTDAMPYFKWLNNTQGFKTYQQGKKNKSHKTSHKFHKIFYKKIYLSLDTVNNHVLRTILHIDNSINLYLTIKTMQINNKTRLYADTSVNLIRLLKAWLIAKGEYNPKYDDPDKFNENNYLHPLGFKSDQIPDLMHQYIHVLSNVIDAFETLFRHEITVLHNFDFDFSVRKRINRIEINRDYIIDNPYISFCLSENTFHAHFVNVHYGTKKKTSHQYRSNLIEKVVSNQPISMEGILQKDKHFKLYTKAKNLLRFEMVLGKNSYNSVQGDPENKSIQEMNEIFNQKNTSAEHDCKYFLDQIFVLIESEFNLHIDVFIYDVNTNIIAPSQENLLRFNKLCCSRRAIREHPLLEDLIRSLISNHKIYRSAQEKKDTKKASMFSLIEALIRYDQLAKLNVRKGYYRPINEFKQYIDALRNATCHYPIINFVQLINSPAPEKERRLFFTLTGLDR